MSDSYDDYEMKIQLAEHEWEMVKTEHDRAVELGKAYERGWNAALAQQEPVAWASSLDFDDDDQEIIPAKDKSKLGTSNCGIPLYTAPSKQWVGLTEREVELIDEMIETQLLHAERCDHITNSTMAQKQKAWDLERVELLRKLKEKNT